MADAEKTKIAVFYFLNPFLRFSHVTKTENVNMAASIIYIKVELPKKLK
jgi:hypothetical protein